MSGRDVVIRTTKTLRAKIKFVGVPQSENCIPLTDSSPLMGEKCPFIESIDPF